MHLPQKSKGGAGNGIKPELTVFQYNTLENQFNSGKPFLAKSC